MPEIAEVTVTLPPQLIYFVLVTTPDLSVEIPVPLSD